MSLDDEQLLPLHPRVDRAEHVVRLAVDGAARRDPRRADESRENAVLVLGEYRPRPFFGERLAKVLRREAHFLSEVDQLLFCELFARIGVRRLPLKLSRARQHALERAAVDGGRRSGCRYVSHTESYRPIWAMKYLYRPPRPPVSAGVPVAQMPPSTTSI